jgi:hypothetical protein
LQGLRVLVNRSEHAVSGEDPEESRRHEPWHQRTVVAALRRALVQLGFVVVLPGGGPWDVELRVATSQMTVLLPPDLVVVELHEYWNATRYRCPSAGNDRRLPTEAERDACDAEYARYHISRLLNALISSDEVRARLRGR